MLLISTFSMAQTVDKWETQGNVADSTTFIGTTNAACLRFRSNNIERMRINEDGKVGIGVENPLKKLDIAGDIRLTGDIIFKGYEDLQDTINRFLMINKSGGTKSVNYNALKASLYSKDCYKVLGTIDLSGLPGGQTLVAYDLPAWASRVEGTKSILYTGSKCAAWVGINTDLPEARLDVRGDAQFSSGVRIGYLPSVSAGLYIENKLDGSNNLVFENLLLIKDENSRRILQLQNNGLLRAREIKVDQANWPDFVFHKDYDLMPLEEVQAYINTYGHLPNVPSAEEVEEDGINLGDAAKTSMQKIEELTLYLLEINEKVENQEKEQQEQAETIKLQQELLQQQQETIRLQQQLIEELKKETSKK